MHSSYRSADPLQLAITRISNSAQSAIESGAQGRTELVDHLSLSPLSCGVLVRSSIRAEDTPG